MDPFAGDESVPIEYALTAGLRPAHAVPFAAGADAVGDQLVAVTTLCVVLGIDAAWVPGAQTFTWASKGDGPGGGSVDLTQDGGWCQLRNGLPTAALTDAMEHLAPGGVFIPLRDFDHLFEDLALDPERGPFAVREEGSLRVKAIWGEDARAVFAEADPTREWPHDDTPAHAQPALRLADDLWVHSAVLKEALGVEVALNATDTHMYVDRPWNVDAPVYRLKVWFLTDDSLGVPLQDAADWLGVALKANVEGREILVEPDPQLARSDEPVDVTIHTRLFEDEPFVDPVRGAHAVYRALGNRGGKGLIWTWEGAKANGWQFQPRYLGVVAGGCRAVEVRAGAPPSIFGPY